jgi:hypothetical protein
VALFYGPPVGGLRLENFMLYQRCCSVVFTRVAEHWNRTMTSIDQDRTAINARRRAKAAQKTAELMDGRTRAGRRRKQLMQAVFDAFGGEAALDELTRAQIKRCCELTIACELMRPKLFAGAVDFVTGTRMESECRRAWAVLRPPMKQPLGDAVPPGPWRESIAAKGQDAA